MPQREDAKTPVIAPDLGLITGAPRHAIPDRGWTKAINARFRLGKAMKVPGWVQQQATALDSQVMGAYSYEPVSVIGGPWWIVVTRNRVYKLSPSDTTFVDITGTALTGGLDDFVSFITYKDQLIFCNGRDAPQTWGGTGTVTALAGSPPVARRWNVFQNHVICCDVDPFGAAGGPFPQRVQWSDLGSATTWVGGEAGSLDLRDEPGNVRTIEQLRDSLLAYKGLAIYLLDYTGFPYTIQTRRLVTGIGPISSRSVVTYRDMHYFLSTDNQIYKMTLWGPENVGQAAYIGLFGELNFQYLNRVYGFINDPDNEILWALPTGGNASPDTAWILEYVTGQWGRREFPFSSAAPRGVQQLSAVTWATAAGTWASQVSTWSSSTFAQGAKIMLAGDTGGTVQKFTPGQLNKNGVAMTMDIEGKMFDLGDPTKRKRVQRLHVTYEAAVGTTLNVYIMTAKGPGLSVTYNGPYTITLDGSGEQWLTFDLTDVYFGVRFNLTALGANAQITGYTFVGYQRMVT